MNQTLPTPASTVIALLAFSVVLAAQSSEFQVLYSFTGGSDGTGPAAGLAVGKGGVLYGTAMTGGGPEGAGTAFSLTAPLEQGGSWAFSSYEFGTETGGYPEGRLAVDRKGDVYGATSEGGSDDGGTLFSLTPSLSPDGAWTASVLYDFGDSPVGFYPESSVVFGLGGALYGTDTARSAVYALAPPSSAGNTWTAHTLHVFGSSPGDGAEPGEGLAVGPGGTLYGTTVMGGAFGGGTVYSVTPPAPPGGAWTEEVLYSFCGAESGCYPRSILAISPGGVLYGTAAEGGIDSGPCGIVYSLTPPTSPGGSWTKTTIHTFVGGTTGLCAPGWGVTLGDGGVLYGVTAGGGYDDNGAIYSLTPPTGGSEIWTFNILYQFGLYDGTSPETSLVFGKDGTLYGTAPRGGNFSGACEPLGCGTVFAFKP